MRARGLASKLHSPQEELVAVAKRRLLRVVVLFKYWMQNHWARDFAGVRRTPLRSCFVPALSLSTRRLTARLCAALRRW